MTMAVSTVDPHSIDLDTVEDILRRFSIALVNVRIHGPSHARVMDAVAGLADKLSAYFREHRGRDHMVITLKDRHVRFDGIPLFEATNYGVKLLQLLERRRAGGFVIGRAATEEELRQFLHVLADSPDAPTLAILARSLVRRQVRNIRFLGPEEADCDVAVLLDRDSPAMTAAAYQAPELRAPLEIYQACLEILQDIMVEIRGGKPIDPEPIHRVTSQIADAIRADENALIPLTCVKYYDEFTFNHSVNVCLLATSLLAPFVREKSELMRVAQASLLHDVGKALIPEEILYKREALTDNEMRVMRSHPRLGAEILLDSEGIDDLSVLVAFGHHLRDGLSGYPSLSNPFQPNPVTNLVFVVDVYEALTAVRPYKKSLQAAEAFQLLLETPGIEGVKPLIRMLFSRLGIYPPGSLVLLDTGYRAVVVRANPDDPARPIVRLVADPTGIIVQEERLIDLSEPADGGDRHGNSITGLLGSSDRLERRWRRREIITAMGSPSRT